MTIDAFIFNSGENIELLVFRPIEDKIDGSYSCRVVILGTSVLCDQKCYGANQFQAIVLAVKMIAAEAKYIGAIYRGPDDGQGKAMTRSQT